MSYQVLARKWRPRNFTELAGQEHVVQALSNALTNNRLHHAYLLTGTRGVGKTTIARILAKSLNCERGVTAMPCGVCAACVAIDEGRFVDLIELDAASNTGIDNMREILDNARYAPTVGRFKVYLVDEVHMLSRAAFNSMLKTLEEPPEHVKFVLATTDPQKIPITVLSRCLQFNLKQLPPPIVARQLEHVLTEENIGFEAGAIRVLARAAQGSMRDGLSLLDQAIAFGSGRVEEAVVRQMLGAVETDYVLRLLEALADKSGEQLFIEAAAMAERNLAFDAALQELAVALHDIALLQTVPTAIADDQPGRDRLLAIAGRLDAETVQLCYQIAVQGRNDLPLAPDEFAGFSMTLLRMLAFAPGGGGSARPKAGDEAPSSQARPLRTAVPVLESGKTSGAPATAARNKPAVNVRVEGAGAPVPSTPHMRSADTAMDLPGAESPIPIEGDVPSEVRQSPSLASRDASVDQDATGLRVPSAEWTQWIADCRLTGLVQQLAMHAEVKTMRKTAESMELSLSLAESNRHLSDRAYQDKLREALGAVLQLPVRLQVEVGGAGAAEGSLAAQERRLRQAQLESAAASFNGDPFVVEAVRLFGAKVRPQSVQPISQQGNKP